MIRRRSPAPDNRHLGGRCYRAPSRSPSVINRPGRSPSVIRPNKSRSPSSAINRPNGRGGSKVKDKKTTPVHLLGGRSSKERVNSASNNVREDGGKESKVKQRSLPREPRGGRSSKLKDNNKPRGGGRSKEKDTTSIETNYNTTFAGGGNKVAKNHNDGLAKNPKRPVSLSWGDDGRGETSLCTAKVSY